MALPTALPGRRSVAYPNTDVPFWESEDRGTVPCPWLELSDRKHGYGCSGHDSRGKTRHGRIKRLMSEVLLCGGDPLSRSQRRCETERSCARRPPHNTVWYPTDAACRRTSPAVSDIGDRNLPTVVSLVGKGYEVELVQSGGRCSVFHMSMGVFEHIGRGVVVYV